MQCCRIHCSCRLQGLALSFKKSDCCAAPTAAPQTSGFHMLDDSKLRHAVMLRSLFWSMPTPVQAQCSLLAQAKAES